jgi:hypothetical protein
VKGDYDAVNKEVSCDFASFSDNLIQAKSPYQLDFPRQREKSENVYSVISIQELYEKPGKIINKAICELNSDTQEVVLKS